MNPGFESFLISVQDLKLIPKFQILKPNSSFQFLLLHAVFWIGFISSIWLKISRNRPELQ